MRELEEIPEENVAAERARVATEGWGARLLAVERQDGHWEKSTPARLTSAEAINWWESLPPERQGTLFPEWTSTAWSLMLLRAFGLDPTGSEAQRAVRRVREHVAWEHDGEPFFAGEVEPCINGKVVALGAYFGQHVHGIVDRLLGEQMSDSGGDSPHGERGDRGGFHPADDGLDGLLRYGRGTGGSPAVSAPPPPAPQTPTQPSDRPPPLKR